MAINLCLGNRGYTVDKESISTSVQKSIKQELTVKAYVNEDYSVPSIPFPIYGESQRKLYVPRFYGIDKYGLPYTSKIDEPQEITCTFSKKLRDIQQPIADAFIEATEKSPYGGGGIISVPCGYGKTVIGLYLACKLGVKTLVVAHQDFLLDQWKERIDFFVKNANIGRIQGKICKTVNKDIVLATLQSLSMKEFNESVFEGFGLVIYDECHHLGAEVFSKALLKTNFKYLLGLSATPKRADGLSKVFEWYLGKIVFQIKKRNQETVNIKLFKYYDEDESYSKVELNFQGKPNTSKMMNNICNYTPRNELIVTEIKKTIDDNRKVLILSNRKSQLESIFDMIGDYCDKGYYLGGMKEKELKKSEEKQLLLATFSMAEEGLDCKDLDTVFLVSPKSNIEQAVGRILRKEVDKREKIPLVIDFIDCFSTFERQGEKRIKFYKKSKYTIENIDLTPFKQNDNEEELDFI